MSIAGLSNSAPFPYGFDEGLELYGKWHGVGWIAAVTDGTDERSTADHAAKTFNLVVDGNPCELLYLRASVMRVGTTGTSALEFGGSHLTPVGIDGPSIRGNSPSDSVRATLYEIDARLALASTFSLRGSCGRARVDDRAAAFDRDLLWFSVEPRCTLSASLFAALRWSEIGTFDANQGYHFDGEPLAGGNEAFGYDTQRLQRLSAGLGWQPHPGTIVKAEVGRDRFWLVNGSPFQPGAADRLLFGLQLVLSF